MTVASSATHQVNESLVAVKGNSSIWIPRGSHIEVTDRSKLPSFVEVVWNAEVYEVRRVDLEACTRVAEVF